MVGVNLLGKEERGLLGVGRVRAEVGVTCILPNVLYTIHRA